MAQNSNQQKIEQLKKQFAQLSQSQKIPSTSTFTPNTAWTTQPLYWQWGIREQTSSEKKKNRWKRAWDVAKWSLSSIYNAATFIPWVLWQIGAAWVDEIAGTDTQSKVYDSLNYIPQKLRDSASSTYHFDKWQEYTDDALMAAALLTAWTTWPKSPKSKLQDLNKNPLKYNASEAYDIVKSAENAWVESIKSWKTRLTPKQVWTKASLNRYWDISNISNSNFEFENQFRNKPAYQQKLFSQYENAKNNANMSTFRDTPSNRTSLYWPNDFSDYWSRTNFEQSLHPLWDTLTAEQIAEMRDYLRQYDNVMNNNYISAEEAEILANDNAILEEMAKKESSKSNTSRARAANTKKKNMSAKERAARERAEDSKNELDLAELEKFAQKMRDDVQNMSLDDMYKLWKSIQNW